MSSCSKKDELGSAHQPPTIDGYDFFCATDRNDWFTCSIRDDNDEPGALITWIATDLSDNIISGPISTTTGPSFKFDDKSTKLIYSKADDKAYQSYATIYAHNALKLVDLKGG